VISALRKADEHPGEKKSYGDIHPGGGDKCLEGLSTMETNDWRNECPTTVMFNRQCQSIIRYYYYYYAAFNVPCVGHKADESHTLKIKILKNQ